MDGDDGQLDTLLQWVADLGYDAQPINADAASYGLPQSCVRQVIVGVLAPGRRTHIDSYDNFFRRLMELFRSCQMKPPSLQDTVLPADSDVVKQALAQNLEVVR